MNFRHIEVFFAVMTSGTVTEAARALGVSQPSVTTTLKHAEADLGIALFRREAGRLIPTAEARALFEEAQRAHEALDSFKHLARQLQVGQGGHVRIAAIPSISLELLPNAISDFMGLNPGFQFSVSTLNTEEILEQLSTKKDGYHLGLTLGQIDDSHVATEHLGESELLVVLPASWEVSRKEEIELADLVDQPYIAGDDSTALARACRILFTQSDIQPRVVARIHTHHLAGRLVQRGLGYAILDSLTVHALSIENQVSDVRIFRLSGKPVLPANAIFPARRALSNPAKLFLDSVRRSFESIAASALV